MRFADNSAGRRRVQRSLAQLDGEAARTGRAFVRALRAGPQSPDRPDAAWDALGPWICGMIAIDRRLGAGVHASTAGSEATLSPRRVRARLEAHELRSILQVSLNASFLVVASQVRRWLQPSDGLRAPIAFEPLDGHLMVCDLRLDLFAADVSLLELRMAIERSGQDETDGIRPRNRVTPLCEWPPAPGR